MAATGDEQKAQVAATSIEAEIGYTELLPTSPLDISALIAKQRLSDGEPVAGG
jgi:hypothetical protein